VAKFKYLGMMVPNWNSAHEKIKNISSSHPLSKNVKNKIYKTMDLRKMGLEGVDWINLAPGGGEWWISVNMLMDIQVP
jgi:hypothetical protein